MSESGTPNPSSPSLDDEPAVKTSDELEGAEREHDAAAQEEDEEPGTGPDERGTAAVGIQGIPVGEPEDLDEDE
jgi:hypothetical protein